MHLAPARSLRSALPSAALLAVGCAPNPPARPAASAPAAIAAPGPARTPDDTPRATPQDAPRRPDPTAPETPSAPPSGAEAPRGPLDPAAIKAVVDDARRRILGCYEDAFVTSHSLSSRVTVRFTIQRDGSVAGAQAEGSVPDEAARRCAVGVVASLVFPRPAGPPVPVTYPILLYPPQ